LLLISAPSVVLSKAITTPRRQSLECFPSLQRLLSTA
jgi:hypothetical protein